MPLFGRTHHYWDPHSGHETNVELMEFLDTKLIVGEHEFLPHGNGSDHASPWVRLPQPLAEGYLNPNAAHLQDQAIAFIERIIDFQWKIWEQLDGTPEWLRYPPVC